MIPLHDRPGESASVHRLWSDDEVFITREAFVDVLLDQKVEELAATGLWQAVMANTGVHFSENGDLERLHRGKLYCVRTRGPDPRLSIDGLVNGLVNNELYRDSTEITSQNLAQIAFLGLHFTPQREYEVQHATAKLRAYIPELGPHFDYLISDTPVR